MARSECVACKNVFSSVSAFDMHRTGSFQERTRRCMVESEMLDRKMVKNERGIWTTGEFDASVFSKKDEVKA